MRFSIPTIASLAAAVLFAGSALAQGEAAAQSLLSPDILEVARFLPPPPAEDSPKAQAELAELHAIETARTPEAFERAEADDETKDASIFASAMGPGFDLKALPATAKLMGEVRREEKKAADVAKETFRRKRPWIVDPSFHACSREDEPLSSYPSGHATMGFSMAVVLGDIAPDRAPALLARASDYGENRLVCGMHFRADVQAGEVLGTAVAQDLLRNSAFRADRDAAAAELRTAGVIH